ncbi:MAG: sigma-70 family RNA polymerase sigma factor [Planctomycetota bacterium]
MTESESDSVFPAEIREHSDRLLRFIELRIRREVRQRVDPEDILQDALLTAMKRWEEYCRHRRVAVYVWLRGLVIDRLIDNERKHLHTEARGVNREQERRQYSESTSLDCAWNFVANTPTPSEDARQNERAAALHHKLQHLPPKDRDILVLRFFEHLSLAEIAETLGVTQNHAKVLQYRALKKIAVKFGDVEQL